MPPSPVFSTDHVNVVDASTSVAISVSTAVEFSATAAVVAVVIWGASLMLVTVTASVCGSLRPPASVTLTVTS